MSVPARCLVLAIDADLVLLPMGGDVPLPGEGVGVAKLSSTDSWPEVTLPGVLGRLGSDGTGVWGRGGGGSSSTTGHRLLTGRFKSSNPNREESLDDSRDIEHSHFMSLNNL